MQKTKSTPGFGVVPMALAVVTLAVMIANQARADHLRGPRLDRVLTQSRDLVIAMAELSHDAAVIVRPMHGPNRGAEDAAMSAIQRMQHDSMAFYNEVLHRVRGVNNDVIHIFDDVRSSYREVRRHQGVFHRYMGMPDRFQRVSQAMMLLEGELSPWVEARGDAREVVTRAQSVLSLVRAESDAIQRGGDRRRAGRARATVTLYERVVDNATSLERALRVDAPNTLLVTREFGELERSQNRASANMRNVPMSMNVVRKDQALDSEIAGLRRSIEQVAGPIARPAPAPGPRPAPGPGPRPRPVPPRR